MSKLPKFLITLAAAAGATIAVSSAQAATYPLGTLYPSVGNVVENVGVGAFTDTFTFDVNSSSSVGGQVDLLPLSLTFQGVTTSVLNISGLSLALEGPSGWLASAPQGSSLSYANLAANTPYEFVVTGTGTGAAGGTYGVAYNVSAVPLPTSLPLFGSALLGIGGVAWRKRRSSSV